VEMPQVADSFMTPHRPPIMGASWPHICQSIKGLIALTAFVERNYAKQICSDAMHKKGAHAQAVSHKEGGRKNAWLICNLFSWRHKRHLATTNRGQMSQIECQVG
jgi:hypothetical protein